MFYDHWRALKESLNAITNPSIPLLIQPVVTTTQGPFLNKGMKKLWGRLGKMTRMDVSHPTVPRRRLEGRRLKGQIPDADT